MHQLQIWIYQDLYAEATPNKIPFNSLITFFMKVTTTVTILNNGENSFKDCYLRPICFGDNYIGGKRIPIDKDIKRIYESDKYKIVLVNSSYEIATNKLNSQIIPKKKDEENEDNKGDKDSNPDYYVFPNLHFL